MSNPFKAGGPGGPGRPRGATGYKTKVQEAFIQVMEQKVGEGNFMQAFLEQFTSDALNNPNSQAAKMLADRLLEPGVLDSIDAQLNKSKREDVDFLQYRIYKKAFDKQILSIQSKERLILKCAGRRAGKTEGNVLEAAIQAQAPDSRILIISLSFGTCLDLYFDKLIKLFEELGVSINKASKNEGVIVLGNLSEIHFHGNSTVDERDKCRGFNWDRVIIDEAQSQKELRYLCEDIIEPTLLDRKGTMVLSGSGPRIRGTYWEQVWNSDRQCLRVNWNLTQNPHIPDHETVLAKIVEDKGISPNSPLFRREYLGEMNAFDDDALVYRLTDKNYYTDEEMMEWISRQPVTDLFLTGGLDYGWTDSDGFVLILGSNSSPEKFLVYEHKKNRQQVNDLVLAIQEGVRQAVAKTGADLSYIYCDHNEQRITHMLSDSYGLPTINALKTNKDLAVEFLQEEVRRGSFKVKRGGVFDDEALRTVFARDEADNLTRLIDHDSFHPDLLDAVIYSLRDVWNWTKFENILGEL